MKAASPARAPPRPRRLPRSAFAPTACRRYTVGMAVEEISSESVPVVMPDQTAARSVPPEAPPQPAPPREVITDQSVGQTIDVTA